MTLHFLDVLTAGLDAHPVLDPDGPVDPATWKLHGACNDADPELFHGPDGETAKALARREEAAQQVCGRCPVRATCRTDALARGETWGVWGGMTQAELRNGGRQPIPGQRRPAPEPERTVAQPAKAKRNGPPAGYAHPDAPVLADRVLSGQIRLGPDGNLPDGYGKLPAGTLRIIVADLHARGLTDFQIVARTGIDRAAVWRVRSKVLRLPALGDGGQATKRVRAVKHDQTTTQTTTDPEGTTAA